MRTLSARRVSSKGFTLVEILIVVIILGILAAIVIPQFTNASQDARKSSLTSQLQTIRSQVELYKLQRLDELPPSLETSNSTDPWAEMSIRTNEDHQNADDAPADKPARFGPYLQAAPANPLNGKTGVHVVTTDAVLGGASGATEAGWILNTSNGKVWATAKNPNTVYNESNPSDEVNTSDTGASSGGSD